MKPCALGLLLVTVLVALAVPIAEAVPTDDAPPAVGLRLARETQPSRVEQTERISRVVKLLGNSGQIDLRNFAGDIVVTAGADGEARLDIVKVARGRDDADAKERLELVDVEVIEREGRLEARARYPRSGTRSVNVRVTYNVTAPSGTSVRIKSISGSVRVSGIRGMVDAESVSGDVHIENGARVERAKTISGDIVIRGVESDVTVEASTVSGNVQVADVKVHRLELDSISGHVAVGPATCELAELTSMTGDVDFTGTLVHSGQYEIRTHDGTVRAILSGEGGFELDASSFSGSIDAQVPITGGDGESRRSVRGTVGDGSARLEVSSFSGDIIIGQR